MNGLLPKSNGALLVELLPDRSVLRGGGDLCEGAKYSVYANRDWFRKFGLASTRLKSRDVVAEEQLHRRVPILELKEGSAISLDPKSSDGMWTVVYVERAGLPTSRILSPSFEEFLLNWEKTCYTHPSIDSLAPWLDPITGQLNPDPAKSQALHQLLCEKDFLMPKKHHA